MPVFEGVYLAGRRPEVLRPFGLLCVDDPADAGGVARFVVERCYMDMRFVVQPAKLYAAFRAWVRPGRGGPLGRYAFYAELLRLAPTVRRRRVCRRFRAKGEPVEFFEGLRLRADGQDGGVELAAWLKSGKPEDPGAIGQFLKNEVDLAPGGKVRPPVLFTAYKSWAEQRAVDFPLGRTGFFRELLIRAPEVKRRRERGGRTDFFVGIEFKEQP